MSIEAMKAALEVLESIGLKTEKMQNAIDLLRLALAQPKREWVGLTEADIYEAMDFDDEFEFAKAIEAKLKEKNCG